MRWMIPLLLSFIGVLPQSAIAQNQPLLRVAAKHVPMPTFDVVDYKLQCPAGYVPSSYSHTAQYPYDVNEDQSRDIIDRTGARIDKSAVTSAAQLDGAGYALVVDNVEHHDKNLEALATCLSTSASSDNTLQLVRVTGNVARLTLGTVSAFCPADAPVAFGGFSNANAVSIQDYGGSPITADRRCGERAPLPSS
jgi:hypothetical protein